MTISTPSITSRSSSMESINSNASSGSLCIFQLPAIIGFLIWLGFGALRAVGCVLCFRFCCRLDLVPGVLPGGRASTQVVQRKDRAHEDEVHSHREEHHVADDS